MIDGVEKKLNSISRFEQNYFYDNNNRLTKEEDIIIGSHEGAEFPTFYINRIHHTYDNNGNALTETFDSGSVDEYSKAFTYNKLGQLTGYSKDNVAVATYAYNAEGLRKSKTVGTETTEFYYYNGTIINEVKDNALYATNILGASGISQRKIGTDSAYFVKNGHGDTVKLIDEEGTEISDYEYDIWGKVESTTGTFDNPYRYTGEYYDEESGMIYLRNRYYNPDIHRFMTEDPIKDGMNWYAYCSNNPIIYVDPLGLDAIVITNENSVDLGVTSAGHTSAIYQDAYGDWFYTYWGDKAAAVIRIPDTYTKWLKDGDVTANSMDSLDDFNKALNNFLWENGFENITSNYTHATYIVGDFTASLTEAYEDVNIAYTHIISYGEITDLGKDGKVFQGHNSPYFFANNNCFDRTYSSLSKGVLADGTNVGDYMEELGFEGGMIPNNAISKFSEVFITDSFVYSEAYSDLLNYATLYEQNSPWAQKASKAAYANAVVGK